MNGNPIYQALALAAATVLLLPVAVAMLAGWTPSRLRDWAVARPYAYALLCIYALAPLNAVPRMLDASTAVVMACGLLGIGFVVAAAVLLIRAGRTVRSGPKASPR
ncbi:hypothetical protein [Streptomyces sp. H34-S4]|uniref:hypothetical protein n=1 Tax=Streptomyces sp. H34-S4 TaxID=2996463 RepID=UPI00226F5D7B|nr:hypothetical protein [Streptomyces sp. H34-S4]MCY0933142.1 hypothetical protein [Streptomyces sp. H34-S4]